MYSLKWIATSFLLVPGYAAVEPAVHPTQRLDARLVLLLRSLRLLLALVPA